jgi:putative membrane protein
MHLRQHDDHLQTKELLMSSIRMFAFSVLFAGAAAPIAHATDAMSRVDQQFVAMVSQGGMFEVKAGNLAAEMGSIQVIKDQGSTEEHDHQLVGDKLKAIMADAGMTFPAALNATFQKELDDLKALSGPAFDQAYVRDMVKVHDADGAAFANEAEKGTNPKLRSFAAETHRIVLSHLGELRGAAQVR